MLSDESLLIAGWLQLAVVLFHAGPALLLMPRRTLRRLGELAAEPEDWPTVSVIIAARDEDTLPSHRCATSSKAVAHQGVITSSEGYSPARKGHGRARAHARHLALRGALL